MKPNDEVIYTIAITGIKNTVNQKSITDELPKHVGSAKMVITPPQPNAPGSITIPRLYTFWREDYQEKAWQEVLMQTIKGYGASIAIDVQPFTHAHGYPQGDVDL